MQITLFWKIILFINVLKNNVNCGTSGLIGQNEKAKRGFIIINKNYNKRKNCYCSLISTITLYFVYIHVRACKRINRTNNV